VSHAVKVYSAQQQSSLLNRIGCDDSAQAKKRWAIPSHRRYHITPGSQQALVRFVSSKESSPVPTSTKEQIKERGPHVTWRRQTGHEEADKGMKDIFHQNYIWKKNPRPQTWTYARQYTGAR
jgi:hypothetical protein